MEVILLVVFVGQTVQKGFRPGRSGELLCKLPQQRCARTPMIVSGDTVGISLL